MTASQPDYEAIFHAARDVPDPHRRGEYVREACGGDEAQVALVEALLAAAATPDSLLDRPAFGPYLQLIGANRAYEPAALAIISFGLTWALIGVLQFVGRGSPRQGQIAGAR